MPVIKERVRMLAPTIDTRYGRLVEHQVLEVDAETAERWIGLGIADTIRAQITPAEEAQPPGNPNTEEGRRVPGSTEQAPVPAQIAENVRTLQPGIAQPGPSMISREDVGLTVGITYPDGTPVPPATEPVATMPEGDPFAEGALPSNVQDALRSAGYDDRAALAEADDAELLAITGVGDAMLARIRELAPPEGQ